jgi:hypothetical protein
MTAFGRRLDIPGGRRNSKRSTVRLAASLQALNCSRPVTLLDVSRAGARMSMPEPMYRGQQVWLKVGEAQIFGTVRWVKDEDCGLVFDEPINSRELAMLRAKGEVVMVRGLSHEERLAMAAWRDVIPSA